MSIFCPVIIGTVNVSDHRRISVSEAPMYFKFNLPAAPYLLFGGATGVE